MDIAQEIQKGSESEVKKWLSSHGVNDVVDNAWPGGQTALHVACSHGRLNIVKLLLKKGANANKTDERGFLPLHAAASARALDICDYLLTKGKLTEPNAETNDKATAFAYICKAGGVTVEPALQEKLLSLLLSKGASINAPNVAGETPLHGAVLTGTLEAVQFLVANGANLNARTPKGDTPLHWCVQGNNTQAMKVLLDAGAVHNQRNKKRQTPYEFAKELGKNGMMELLSSANNTPLNVSPWCDMGQSRPSGWSLRYYSLLVGKGADKLFVIGGAQNLACTEPVPNTILQFDVVTEAWSTIELQGAEMNIMKTAGAYREESNSVVVCGGVTCDQKPSLCVYEVNLTSHKCHMKEPGGAPPILVNHDSFVEQDTMVCFGGTRSQTNAVSCLDMAQWRWTHVFGPRSSSDGTLWPSKRDGASFVRIAPRKGLLFGGTSGSECFDTLYLWDMDSEKWSLVEAAGDAPCARHGHAAAVIGNLMAVMGGETQDGKKLSDMYLYDHETQTWQCNEEMASSVCSPWEPRAQSGECMFQVLPNGMVSLLDLQVVQEVVEGAGDSDSDTDLSLSSCSVVEMLASKSVSISSVMGSPVSRKPSTSSATSSGGSPRALSLESSAEVKRREKLEQFATKTSTDALEIVSLLLEGIASETITISDAALKEAIEKKCAELQMFCVVNRPKKSWVSLSPVSLSEKDKTKSRSGTASFTFTPFPRSHYEKLDLPPKWDPERVKIPEDAAIVKRAKVANELLATETAYVRDLGVLIGFYLRPLQVEYDGLVEQYDVSSLFKNVEQLYGVNTELLQRLEEEIAKPDKEQMLGSVFLEMMSELKKYNSYSANNQAGVETLDKLMASKPQFVLFAAEAKKQKECKQLDFGGYITKPFQRICRYPLLLRELIDVTPKEWPDFANLEQALALLNKTVKGANETKRVTDDLYKVVQIQNRFTTLTSELAQLHKMQFVVEFVCKVMVKSKLKKAEVFVFSEMVLVARPKGSSLVAHASFPQTGFSVEVDSKVTKFALAIASKAVERCVLAFKSAEERSRAMGHLERFAVGGD